MEMRRDFLSDPKQLKVEGRKACPETPPSDLSTWRKAGCGWGVFYPYSDNLENPVCWQ